MKQLVENYIDLNHGAFQLSESGSDVDIARFFGNRLLVLKVPTSQEKGVLFVMFSETIQQLPACMNMPALLKDYTLVFEPSWSGYCFWGLLQYNQFREDIFVLAAEDDDFRFLRSLKSNLIPVKLGPCDWVDPNVAVPYLHNSKMFDIVMNSNWAAWKRHYVLFKMLANAGRRFSVVLIGLKWGGRTKEDIVDLAKAYSIHDQITLMDQIPYDQVMRVTCQSKVSVLLSLKEGSNRAIAESMRPSPR